VDAQRRLENWLQNASSEPIVILQGMGGSGKTQLALKCCQMAQNRRFIGTLWINASSPSTVMQSYRSILRLFFTTEGAEDEVSTISQVRRQIEQSDGKWLLVFDNYDNPKAFTKKGIRDYFPSQSTHILVTSRHKDSSRLGQSFDLSKMSEDESIKLLSYAVPTSEISQAIEVASMLGYLALALDQAGAYIRERDLSLPEFVSHYKKRSRIILEEIPDEWEYRNIQDPENERSLSAFTTWEMSLDLIKGSIEVKEQKTSFLTLVSFLDPYQISGRYFQEYSKEGDADWIPLLLTKEKWDIDKLGDMLGEFQKLSLIQSFKRHKDECAFSIHPLISDWMKHRRPTVAPSKIIQITKLLSIFLNAFEIAGLPLEIKQEIARHIDAWVSANENILQDSYETVLALHDGSIMDIVRVYHYLGQHGEAKRLCQLALEESENTQGMKHFLTLHIVGELAIINESDGRFAECERLLKRVLEGYEEIFGPTHSATQAVIHNLAVTYYCQGRYEEAKETFEQNLQTKDTLGLKNRSTLRTCFSLANVYHDMGLYEDAERLHKEALDGKEEILGPKHPSVLKSVASLADTYSLQGKYEKAEELSGRALEGLEEVLGPKHPITLDRVHNIGISYMWKGDYEKAESMLTRALDGNMEILGIHHESTAHSMRELASLYERQGRQKEADELRLRIDSHTHEGQSRYFN
jgi:tetratricopeptide (TPR) repeat protein